MKPQNPAPADTLPGQPIDAAGEDTRHLRPAARTRTGLLGLDKRTLEGRLFKTTLAELRGHLGRPPTATEAKLIERCAVLTVHLTRLDRALLKASPGAPMREYVVVAGQLQRIMVQLGLEAPPAQPATLADYLAAREAAAHIPTKDS